MRHAFANIAFTPAVRDVQARDGSRAQYARAFESGDEVRNADLGADEAAFIHAQRSFYMATVSETGWPYVQHRGGAPGFLRVVDAKTLTFWFTPGPRVECKLTRRDDGSFEGPCLNPAGQEARMLMTPPKKD